MVSARGMHISMVRGKGYEPGYKTKDKDLIIPIIEQDEEEDKKREENDVSEVSFSSNEKRSRPRGGYKVMGENWTDEALPAAPMGWSPRGQTSTPDSQPQ